MGIYDDTYIYIGDEENFGFFYWLLCSFAFYLWFIQTYLYNSCLQTVTKFIISEKATKFNKSPNFKGDFFKNTLTSQFLTYALSFYRSQNVFCCSKFFVPDQKFIYILCQSQTFCARQKDDLHLVKLVFVQA